MIIDNVKKFGSSLFREQIAKYAKVFYKKTLKKNNTQKKNLSSTKNGLKQLDQQSTE